MLRALYRMVCKIQNNAKFTKEQEMFANWTSGSIKTDELGINVPISWTRRTQNISKNENVCLYQSRITLFTLIWDTLYLRWVILINTDFGPIGYSLSSCGILFLGLWLMNFHCVHSYLHIGTFKIGLYCESTTTTGNSACWTSKLL